jgi:hypothetical protein
MARVGGRSLWLAWPAGVLCAAVVGVLVWLAAPGVPGAIDFVGSTLRGATSAPQAGGAAAPDDEPATDCRSLYPDRLWSALTWTPQVLLSQGRQPPASESGLEVPLSAEVRFTCGWRAEGDRSISTTVAEVVAASAPVARAALEAEGFACSGDDTAVHCVRVAAGATEIHDVRDTTWMSTVMSDWEIDDYAELTASRAFG